MTDTTEKVIVEFEEWEAKALVEILQQHIERKTTPYYSKISANRIRKHIKDLMEEKSKNETINRD
jgi:tRNA-dihydrouridine synthase